jgi:sugar phosphate permease
MEDNLVRKMLSFRWFIFGILAIAYFFVYFHRLSLSVVANDIATDFGTTASILGLLGSVYFYCYAAMQFPAGLFSDSIGPRKTVAISLLLACIGSILFGLAPNITVAFAARVMVGLGVSMVFIPTMKILSQWFRVNEFALMSGILNSIGGMGVFAATWLLGILATNFGWRVSFQLIGGCTLLLIVSAWLIVQDRPADKGWPSINEIDGKNNKNDLPLPQKIGLWEGACKVVSEKYFWPVAIWFFFVFGIFFGFGGLWSGPYLMHVYGKSREQVGDILSMLAWGMIIGGPFLGVLSEKVLKSRKKTIVLCTSVLTALLLFINFLPSQLPLSVLTVWFFLFSVCSSAIVTIGITATKELFPVEIAGTSVGTVNLFPFLGGAVFMSLLGRVLDSYPKTSTLEYSVHGYRMVLLILLAASAISLICTFFMKETYRR